MRLHLEKGYSKNNTEIMEPLKHIHPSHIFQGAFKGQMRALRIFDFHLTYTCGYKARCWNCEFE